MKQVVLHAADHAGEGRQVGGEDAVTVHAPQLVGDADRLPQDGHEQLAGLALAAEHVVDQIQMLPDQANGRSADALEVRLGLQQQEDAEQRERVFPEDVVMADLDVVVDGLELVVDRLNVPFIGAVQGNFLEELHEQFVQPLQAHDRAVIELHELLDRLIDVLILNTELAGQILLVLEQQPVLAAVGHDVQGEADFPQKITGLEQFGVFRLGEPALADQIQRSGVVVTLDDPVDVLDVAQAARTLLDVGLEVVGGVVEFGVAGGLLGLLGFEELGRGPKVSG